jgi:hypothetical protein
MASSLNAPYPAGAVAIAQRILAVDADRKAARNHDDLRYDLRYGDRCQYEVAAYGNALMDVLGVEVDDVVALAAVVIVAKDAADKEN